MTFGLEIYAPNGQVRFSSENRNLFFEGEFVFAAGTYPTYTFSHLSEEIAAFAAFRGVWDSSNQLFQLTRSIDVSVDYALGYPRVILSAVPHVPSSQSSSGNGVLTVFRTGKFL